MCVLVLFLFACLHCFYNSENKIWIQNAVFQITTWIPTFNYTRTTLVFTCQLPFWRAALDDGYLNESGNKKLSGHSVIPMSQCDWVFNTTELLARHVTATTRKQKNQYFQIYPKKKKLTSWKQSNYYLPHKIYSWNVFKIFCSCSHK